MMVMGGRSFSGHERNCVFLNTGSGRFADVSAVTGLDLPDDARAVGVTDWDLDGDLDLWIVNRSGPQVRVLRNDSPRENAWVAVRLVGSAKGNRDAIGARVEARVAGARPLVKTLRAGEGYLAQSSKWVHFGLGRDPRLEKIVVRWPEGALEEFPGIEAGRRWELAQGSGKASPWTPPARSVDLAPSVLDEHHPPARSRVFFANRLPLIQLMAEDAEGKPLSLGDPPPGAPLLINLWSSSCKACSAELRELVRRAPDLQASGLRVRALNVEIAGAAGADPERARRFLADLAWAFDSGFAGENLIDRLETLESTLFTRLRPLALPTSLLVDPEGRLAAWYRGPVEVDALLDDLRHLGDDAPARLARALPFPGRWHRLRMDHPSRRLAEQSYVGGSTDDAERFYRQALLDDPRDAAALSGLGVILAERGAVDEAMRLLLEAERLRPEDAVCHARLGLVFQLVGKPDDSERHLRRAVELAPDDAEARFDLADLLRSRGRLAPAAVEYEAALRLEPKHAEAHLMLGILRAHEHKFTEAIRLLSQAVELAPASPQAHFHLGTTLAASGSLAPAASELETALRLDPQLPGARARLEHVQSMLKQPR